MKTYLGDASTLSWIKSYMVSFCFFSVGFSFFTGCAALFLQIQARFTTNQLKDLMMRNTQNLPNDGLRHQNLKIGIVIGEIERVVGHFNIINITITVRKTLLKRFFDITVFDKIRIHR